MKREPAAQCVLEIVLFVRAEQKIIRKLAAHAPVAGVPMRLGLGEVWRVRS
jgi:hypothetical protein